jgi:hypothetical protein
VHVPANVPVLLVVRPTVPVGVMKVPGEVSETVILHVVAVPTVTGEPQLTLVVVVLRVTVMLVVPLLAE